MREAQERARTNNLISAMGLNSNDSTSDYILNKAGAKIYYRNASKHEKLPIPIINADNKSGNICEVLSVGTIPGLNGGKIATIKHEDDAVVAYLLPKELDSWVDDLMGYSVGGVKLLPGTVEFGNLDGRIYAEIH